MARPMQVEVSDVLRATVVEIGSDAQRWLEEVPSEVLRIAEAWDLELHDQLDHIGMCSIVFPATTSDGTPAILKLSIPHDEVRGEAPALRRWDGDGAARLLRSSDDGFTLLLERCTPGHDLWTLPIDGQIAVTAELLPRLWVDTDLPPSIPRLVDTAATWARRMSDEPETFDAPAEVVARASRWADELREDAPRPVLLHGDLNPGNVLAAGREPWLAIDPKPYVGEPSFDLGQMLMNWVWSDDVAGDEIVRRTVERAAGRADELAFDVGRVLRWAAVKAVGWGAPRDECVVLDAAARAVTP